MIYFKTFLLSMLFLTLWAKENLKEVTVDTPKQVADIRKIQLEIDKQIAPYLEKYQDDTPIITINGKAVLFKEIKIGFNNSLANHLKLYKDKPLNEEVVQSYLDPLIGRLIVKKLLLQEVISNNLFPLEDDLKVRFKDFKQKILNSKYKNIVEFNEINDELMKNTLKEQMGIEAYYKELDKTAKEPTEEDAKKVYDNQKTPPKEPRKIRFSIIYIDNNDGSPEAVEKNKKLILKLRDQIISKEKNFEKVAKNFSDHESSRKKGGDYGYVYVNKLEAMFTPVIKLELNQISQVFALEKAFYIAKLTESIPETVITFERLKDKILTMLKRQELLKVRQKRINELQKKSEIKKLI